MALGVAIGAITFTGSVIAFAKLSGRMSGKPILLPMRHVINAGLGLFLVFLIYGFIVSGGSAWLFWLITFCSLLIGVLIIIPIGGADMPVVISMLNSYSGWAAAGIGFTLGNVALIITGALVGSSGAILSYIMCKGMNRQFLSVIAGGFGGETAAAGAGGGEQKPVKLGSAEDAGYVLQNAAKVIIVPGYGMAVAQAQHALREMADALKKAGVEVKYAIHPVAGRMPGHMNVLLAEANVPYDEVFELDDINSEFAQADAVYVIGANDVVNPAAEDDKTSPIYGMPVLQVWKAGTVFFNKRSLASGYAGIDNPVFYRDNTVMVLGDAKKMTEEIVKSSGELAARDALLGLGCNSRPAIVGPARAIRGAVCYNREISSRGSSVLAPVASASFENDLERIEILAATPVTSTALLVAQSQRHLRARRQGHSSPTTTSRQSLKPLRR